MVKTKTTNGENRKPLLPCFVERVAASSCGLPVAAFRSSCGGCPFHSNATYKPLGGFLAAIPCPGYASTWQTQKTAQA